MRTVYRSQIGEGPIILLWSEFVILFTVHFNLFNFIRITLFALMHVNTLKISFINTM